MEATEDVMQTFAAEFYGDLVKFRVRVRVGVTNACSEMDEVCYTRKNTVGKTRIFGWKLLREACEPLQ
jgi:hypothetical protein